MSEGDQFTRWCVEEMRRAGEIVVRFDVLDTTPDEWRRRFRAEARRRRLRVRTGTSGETVVWAHHVDHVSTEAEQATVLRLMNHYHDHGVPGDRDAILAEERRKRIGVVNPAEADRDDTDR